MDKRILLGAIFSGIFYLSGLCFAVYFAVLAIAQNTSFDISSLINISLCVMGALTAGTVILTVTMREKDKKYKTVRAYLYAVLFFYVLVLFLILFRNPARRLHPWSGLGYAGYLRMFCNFIPFKTILGYVSAYIHGTINQSAVIANMFGNLFLFAPMGFLLPSLFSNLRKFGKLVLISLAILAGVEVLQFVTLSGSCDIDDIILNMTGLLLFYGIWRIKSFQKLLRRIHFLE